MQQHSITWSHGWRHAPWFTLLVAATIAFTFGFASAAWLGGTEDFTAEIVVRIVEINAAVFAGLLVLHRLAIAGGIAAVPALQPAAGLHA